jgi:2-oxoisovalerate dehydrogenase E1 component alpha subunit
MIWATRPSEELPILMIITNNEYGISTPGSTQHGEKCIVDRAKTFGIATAMADGNNPEKAWSAISQALEFVRSSGKPYMLELKVSRLYGHSSSSGANKISETDCLDIMEKKLLKNNWLTDADIQKLKIDASQEANAAYEIARQENYPDAQSIHEDTFAQNKKGGLPGRDS